MLRKYQVAMVRTAVDDVLCPFVLTSFELLAGSSPQSPMKFGAQGPRDSCKSSDSTTRYTFLWIVAPWQEAQLRKLSQAYRPGSRCF